MAQFRRPVMLRPAVADAIPGGGDVAARLDGAHRLTRQMLRDARRSPEGETSQRLVRLGYELDAAELGELFGAAGPDTLPGTLLRLYRWQQWLANQGDQAALWFRLGAPAAAASSVISGVVMPPSAADIRAAADQILASFFADDPGDALDRAQALADVLTVGIAVDADARDATNPVSGSIMTTTAAYVADLASNFGAAAKIARAGALE